ncbi:MAG: CesT family type III secretion system chaperone [Candidatus Competibacteraceae bacterium]
MAGELDKLAAQFAERRQLNEPHRDEQGRYYFLFDGSLEVALFQTGDRIYLEGRLAPIPADNLQAEAVLTRNLKRHLARLRDKQEVLSMDPEDGRLVLFRQLSARSLSILDFEQAMESFVNGLAFWSEDAGSRPQAAVPPPPMHMLFP